MVIEVTLQSLEVEIPDRIAIQVVQEEMNKMKDSDLIVQDYSIRQLLRRRIYELIHQYDAGKMDFIRKGLGIIDGL